MDEPRLTDDEFRIAIRRLQKGTIAINAAGGFQQMRGRVVFDPRRHGPPFTELEDWICEWQKIWDLVSTEAHRRSVSGVIPESQKETFTWPKENFVGGGRMPNEDPDEYIQRMRDILYPKKKGGRRKKNDSNRENSNLVRTTSPLFEGD